MFQLRPLLLDGLMHMRKLLLLLLLPLLSDLTFQKLTVGKIYAGLLVAENWKSFKASQSRKGRHDAVSAGVESSRHAVVVSTGSAWPCSSLIEIIAFSIINFSCNQRIFKVFLLKL